MYQTEKGSVKILGVGGGGLHEKWGKGIQEVEACRALKRRCGTKGTMRMFPEGPELQVLVSSSPERQKR